jgi:uncharacterized membrane protein
MTVQVQRVGVTSGLKWIVDGFALFRLRPLVWIALAAVWLLFSLVLLAIPHLGQLVLYLVTPALGAGMLVGCRALERGNDLEIAHLFAGFRSHPGPLITIGGVYLLGNVITFGVFMMLGGQQIVTAALERASDPTSPPPDIPAAPLLSVLLLVPLFMAVIFAPALTLFRGLPALEAMKASFTACLENLLPVMLFAVVSAVLAMLAMVPYGLGALVYFPVNAGAVYRGYEALFGNETPAAEAPT